MRSFADEIRGRSDEELSELILGRPDLAHPAPADLTALAGRASTRASLVRALDHLPADQLRALEAHLVAATVPASPGSLLGISSKELATRSERLRELALLWQDGKRLRPVRTLLDVLTHPAGLGPTAEQLGVPLPVDLPDRLGALSGPAAALIDRMRWRHWQAEVSGSTGRAAADDLIRQGLAVERDGALILPREVSIAARGGRLHQTGLRPPEPTAASLDQSALDAAGASQSLELLWAVSEIAHAFDDDAPRVLRGGGLGVREHRALAARLDTTPEFAAFALEVAHAAGLFASDNEADPSWRPTHAYDEWAVSSRASRLAVLIRAWWTTLRAPSLSGGRGTDGSVVNVLGPDAVWPMLRGRRHDVVQLLASLEPGATPTLPEVEEGLRWRRPVRLAGDVPTHAPEILREASWLGVTALGGLTSAGRAMATDGDVVAAIEAALPEPIDHVLLQADLTAIAPGPLTDDLDEFMRLAADVESRGGATVFRFSEASLTRAFDRGMDADELRKRLRSASRTPVPQPLDYLVGDVARRHGAMRVGSVASYLRSDDESTLGMLVADPDLHLLQLRRIAPTVVVSPVTAATVLALVREHHHGVVAETSDGGVVLSQGTSARAPSPTSPAATVVRSPVREDALALVSALRAGEDRVDKAPHPGPRIPNMDPSMSVTLLLDAAADGHAVWIGYVDPNGSLRRMLFRPNAVDGGRVTGTPDDPSAPRALPIHRITGVTPA